MELRIIAWSYGYLPRVVLRTTLRSTKLCWSWRERGSYHRALAEESLTKGIDEKKGLSESFREMEFWTEGNHISDLERRGFQSVWRERSAHIAAQTKRIMLMEKYEGLSEHWFSMRGDKLEEFYKDGEKLPSA